MARITGIGGIFFKAQDIPASIAWYKRVLGLELDAGWNGLTFAPADMAAQPGGQQVFALFAADTEHFKPSDLPFMINLCVDDLDGVLKRCATEGVTPVWRSDDDTYGAFAHIIDPNGIKLELWQPV